MIPTLPDRITRRHHRRIVRWCRRRFVARNAIAHINSTTAGGSGVTTLSINVPASVANNDFLILYCVCRGTQTFTDPAGWTLIDEIASGSAGTDARLRILYRVASSEPASYTLTISASGPLVAGMSAYSGVSTSSPIDASAKSATGTCPTCSPAATNGLAIRATGQRVSTTGPCSYSPPTSYTERVDRNTGAGSTDSGVSAADWGGYATPTGTATFTYGAVGGQTVTMTVVLSAAATTPAPTRRRHVHRSLVAQLGGRRR